MSNQSVARIDDNDKPTLLAYNTTTSAPEDIRCDPIFNYLEIFGAAGETGGATSITRAFIDNNENSTLLGYNDTTGQIEALRCDSQGNLLVLPV